MSYKITKNRNMEKKDIIDICQKNKEEFRETIGRINCERKGIFNSEMLMFVSVVRELGVKTIIESGRARGQSTKVISNFFKGNDYKIYSIESQKYTKDALIANKRLKEIKNLELMFGNTCYVLPKLLKELKEPCCILIDGPKGDEAIQLSIKLLKNNLVKAVFIHDVHKNTPHRDIIETLFLHTFFSDDKDYVEHFKDLDIRCWEKYNRNELSPYLRKGKKIQSYASTLGIIFNGTNAINSLKVENYFKYQDYKKKSLKRFIGRKILGLFRKITNYIEYFRYKMQDDGEK